MDLKHELESWKALSESYGYELVPTGSASWRIDFAADVFAELRLYQEPDEMILSGSHDIVKCLQSSFHCAALNEREILLAKDLVESRIDELCRLRLESEVTETKVISCALAPYRAAKVELMKSRMELISDHGTEEECAVRRRKGQNLLANYLYLKFGKCFVTGLTKKPLLVASHIKPWADSRGDNTKERLDEDNVLLLSVAYDKLFDRGYISFADDGSLLVCENSISFEELGLLGVDGQHIPRLGKEYLTDRRCQYLNYHRKHIFGKKC